MCTNIDLDINSMPTNQTAKSAELKSALMWHSCFAETNQTQHILAHNGYSNIWMNEFLGTLKFENHCRNNHKRQERCWWKERRGQYDKPWLRGMGKSAWLVVESLVKSGRGGRWLWCGVLQISGMRLRGSCVDDHTGHQRPSEDAH